MSQGGCASPSACKFSLIIIYPTKFTHVKKNSEPVSSGYQSKFSLFTFMDNDVCNLASENCAHYYNVLYN